MAVKDDRSFISIARLSKSFSKGDEVIRDLSLDISEGEFVVITGRSGIGKTLLLRIICGLERPSKGEVLLRGRPIAAPPHDFAIVFQDYRNSLLLWKTALENVVLALSHADGPRHPAFARREVAREYLREVGLENYADHYPYQLSGGQQQRICFARALAQNPRCLLLDEPFGAVDHLTKLELEDLLLSLYERHRFTCLMTTHDLDEAAYVASRAVVFSSLHLSVAADITIPLPYPRSQTLTRAGREFAAIRTRLYELLAGDGDQ
jgi:NitT/TauT family transport system ATP-binding protein